MLDDLNIRVVLRAVNKLFGRKALRAVLREARLSHGAVIPPRKPMFPRYVPASPLTVPAYESLPIHTCGRCGVSFRVGDEYWNGSGSTRPKEIAVCEVPGCKIPYWEVMVKAGPDKEYDRPRIRMMIPKYFFE